MKFSYVSAVAALAAAAALAGCGGKAQFTVQGTFNDALGNIVSLPNSGHAFSYPAHFPECSGSCGVEHGPLGGSNPVRTYEALLRVGQSVVGLLDPHRLSREEAVALDTCRRGSARRGCARS